MFSIFISGTLFLFWRNFTGARIYKIVGEYKFGCNIVNRGDKNAYFLFLF